MSNTAKQIKKILEDEESYGTTLLTICVDRYGTEFFEWEPSTLYLELAEDFRAQLPETNKDKLWALVTAITTNQFYFSLEAFVHICNSLSGSGASMEVWDELTPEEAAWGITEVFLNDPPTDDPEYRFSPEIQAYLGYVLDQYGIVDPPDVLRVATYDGDPKEIAEQAAEDDPILYEAMWEHQRGKAGEIIEHITENMRELISQLQMLPLRNARPQFVQSLYNRFLTVTTEGREKS